jgi:hypothetical protein
VDRGDLNPKPSGDVTRMSPLFLFTTEVTISPAKSLFSFLMSSLFAEVFLSIADLLSVLV